MIRAGLAAAGAIVSFTGAAVGFQSRTEITEVVPEAMAQGGVDADGAPLSGAMVFRVKGCGACHDGPETTGISGVPSLRQASSWAGERRPGLSAEEYLAESIRDPGAFISPAFTGGLGPMSGMPVLGLSEAEIGAVVGYLLGE